MTVIDHIMTMSIPELAKADERELMDAIRQSVTIHHEMFSRILKSGSAITPTFVELFEDLGNVYLSYSEELARRLPKVKIE